MKLNNPCMLATDGGFLLEGSFPIILNYPEKAGDGIQSVGIDTILFNPMRSDARLGFQETVIALVRSSVG